jgi:hypothetical protein
MIHSQLGLLWFALGVVAFFALVIYFGLKSRKKQLAANQAVNALEVWQELSDPQWNFADLLFGVWQDFSATALGMLVKNSQDQQVGTIVFKTAARQNWITIKTNDATFSCDVLPAMKQSVLLRRAEEASPTLCTFSRLAGGTFHFETENNGVIESRPPKGLHMTPRFEYSRNGGPIGISQHIGGSRKRGISLVLPSDLPLPIRMFVLAMQGQRA